jgi:hypothetical protein
MNLLLLFIENIGLRLLILSKYNKNILNIILTLLIDKQYTGISITDIVLFIFSFFHLL